MNFYTQKMKLGIAVKFSFILLAYNVKFSPTCATKIVNWDRIDETKKSYTRSFSFLCQDQIVNVKSNIYHLDRLRSSLKSAYFEKLFTSDVFKQKNNPVVKIQPLNSEVFPTVVDLIHEKELSDVLSKENYFPLLRAMDYLGMEIDLEKIRSFVDHNLASYSLQEAKIFALYIFIRYNPKFEYLLDSVFKRFSIDLTTLQKHEIFLSLPVDHLIRIINKVEHPNDEKRYAIIQMCTEWLCHDMEKRLFHLANLATSIKSKFHSSTKTNTGINQWFPKCDADQETKQQIISRCIFALLANKNLDPKKLDEQEPDEYDNSEWSSAGDVRIFHFYNFVKNNVKFEHLLEGVMKHFANYLTWLESYTFLQSLPYDHLLKIIKNIEQPDNKKIYKIIKFCTEWICGDMENRLPHLVNLVISTKSLLHSSIETNMNVSNYLPRCNVDKKSKRQIISKCLCVLLTDGEQLTKIFADNESNYHSDDGYYSEDNERKSSNSREYVRFVNRNNEYTKLKKFAENGDFCHDITVRVGEKTYKLHRAILESRCGYFRDYFRAEYAEAVAQYHDISKCPSKEEEYVLNDPVDSSTFDAVLDYIYFGNFYGWNDMDVIVRIFITVDTLEIQDGRLLEYCKRNLMDCHPERISSQSVVQILNFIHGKTKYDDLYLLYLCKHIPSKWPNIYNVSHFCSIPWTMLENVLKSPDFRFTIHSHTIFDICSKWITHDVKNRYQYLPRIAQIINPHSVDDHNKYTPHVARELNDFSGKFIENKLGEILSSLSNIIQTAELSSMPMKLKSMPAIIVTNRDQRTINILNIDFDLLESINVSEGARFHRRCINSKSALIGDNLFVLSDLFQQLRTFSVYNFSSKKFTPLNSDLGRPCNDFNLLNCKNEVYGYSEFGHLVKYVMQLNRWVVVWEPVKFHKNSVQFTSDGKTIYGIREYCESKYVIEAFDFKNNSWSSVPDVPIMESSASPAMLSVINDHDFIVSSSSEIVLLHRDSKTWRRFQLPEALKESEYFVRQHKDIILFVDYNEVYRFFPTNGSIELMKDLSKKYSKY